MSMQEGKGKVENHVSLDIEKDSCPRYIKRSPHQGVIA